MARPAQRRPKPLHHMNIAPLLDQNDRSVGKEGLQLYSCLLVDVLLIGFSPASPLTKTSPGIRIGVGRDANATSLTPVARP